MGGRAGSNLCALQLLLPFYLHCMVKIGLLNNLLGVAGLPLILAMVLKL
jgi:hypothetical protein